MGQGQRLQDARRVVAATTILSRAARRARRRQRAGEPWRPVVAEELRLLDHAVRGGHAVYPTPMQTQIEAPSAMTAGLLGNQRTRVHRVKLACPLSDTRDPEFASSVPGQLGCAAESLEAFAVAQACSTCQRSAASSGVDPKSCSTLRTTGPPRLSASPSGR